LFKKKEEGGDDYRSKKIHVRSKDPSRIARQFEKGIDNSSKSKGKGVSRCMLHPLFRRLRLRGRFQVKRFRTALQKTIIARPFFKITKIFLQ
jgi:hypothetical protein